MKGSFNQGVFVDLLLEGTLLILQSSVSLLESINLPLERLVLLTKLVD